MCSPSSLTYSARPNSTFRKRPPGLSPMPPPEVHYNEPTTTIPHYLYLYPPLYYLICFSPYPQFSPVTMLTLSSCVQCHVRRYTFTTPLLLLSPTIPLNPSPLSPLCPLLLPYYPPILLLTIFLPQSCLLSYPILSYLSSTKFCLLSYLSSTIICPPSYLTRHLLKSVLYPILSVIY